MGLAHDGLVFGVGQRVAFAGAAAGHDRAGTLADDEVDLLAKRALDEVAFDIERQGDRRQHAGQAVAE